MENKGIFVHIFFRDKVETTPALPLSDAAGVQSESKTKDVLRDMSELTNDTIDESNIVKKHIARGWTRDK